MSFVMWHLLHYSYARRSAVAGQITDVSIVYSNFCSGADQKKPSKQAPRHWWSVNSPHKGTVTRKMFPFDDVNMDALGPIPLKIYGQKYIFCFNLRLKYISVHVTILHMHWQVNCCDICKIVIWPNHQNLNHNIENTNFNHEFKTPFLYGSVIVIHCDRRSTIYSPTNVATSTI